MARNFRGRGRVVQRSDRKSTWIVSADATGLTTLSASGKLLHQSFTSAQIDAGIGPQSTVVRTRGLLSVVSDQAAATETVFGAVGMAIVSDTARGVGATAVPGLFSEAFWDGWFVHFYFTHGMRLVDATGVAEPNQSDIPFDSKAMRKVPDDSAIVIMIENGAAAAGFNFVINFRTARSVPATTLSGPDPESTS